MTPEIIEINKLPESAGRLLNFLFEQDKQTNGNPQLRDEDIAYAREWLVEVLLGTSSRFAHTDALTRLYGGKFRGPHFRHEWPAGRPPAPAPDPLFRHSELLPDDKADAVAERGVEVLAADELARLLLNPIALWDLADLLDYRLPDWCREPMYERGLKLMAECGFEGVGSKPRILVPAPDETMATDATKRSMVEPMYSLMGAAKLASKGAGCWKLEFVGESSHALARQIAETMYGDLGRSFELLLYRIDAGKGRLEYELEVLPAPTKDDLTFTIEFPGALRREFVLEVPPEVRRDPKATARLAVRSDACEPLDAATGDIGAPGRTLAWGDEMPPRLMVCVP